MTFKFISVKIESIEHIFSQTKSIYLNCENYEIKKKKKVVRIGRAPLERRAGKISGPFECSTG